MSHPSRAHLDAIGIPVWVRRRGPRTAGQVEVPLATTGAEAAPVPSSEQANVPLATTGIGASPAPASGVLEALDAQVRACRKCELHGTRTRTVFGVGRPDAACMFIGEAPGAEEDARGEPFVGRAGKLLDAMLAAIGLGRGDVYIANIVKCRPPRNRDPSCGRDHRLFGLPQASDRGGVLRVCSSRPAGWRPSRFLSTTKSIGTTSRPARTGNGEDGIPVLVMYHPAYFLRSPLTKRKAWDDLVRLRSMLSDECGERPVNAVACELHDIAFRPMLEADLDEVLSIEHAAYDFPWSREVPISPDTKASDT